MIQLQRRSPPVFGRFSSVKNSSPIHILIRKSHNDTCIHASDVPSFNRLLQSLFTHILVLAKPKLQSVARGDHTPLRFITTCNKNCYPILYAIDIVFNLWYIFFYIYITIDSILFIFFDFFVIFIFVVIVSVQFCIILVRIGMCKGHPKTPPKSRSMVTGPRV